MAEKHRSEVIQRILEKMANDPWHVRLKRHIRVMSWFWKKNWIHRINWICSKQYRESYGDCDCFTTGRKIDDEYCKSNKKCNLKKARVSYIEV